MKRARDGGGVSGEGEARGALNGPPHAPDSPGHVLGEGAGVSLGEMTGSAPLTRLHALMPSLLLPVGGSSSGPAQVGGVGGAGAGGGDDGEREDGQVHLQQQQEQQPQPVEPQRALEWPKRHRRFAADKEPFRSVRMNGRHLPAGLETRKACVLCFRWGKDPKTKRRKKIGRYTRQQCTTCNVPLCVTGRRVVPSRPAEASRDAWGVGGGTAYFEAGGGGAKGCGGGGDGGGGGGGGDSGLILPPMPPSPSTPPPPPPPPPSSASPSAVQQQGQGQVVGGHHLHHLGDPHGHQPPHHRHEGGGGNEEGEDDEDGDGGGDGQAHNRPLSAIEADIAAGHSCFYIWHTYQVLNSRPG